MLQPAMAVTLIHIHGGMKGEIQEYFDSVITIGRLPSLTLHFPPEEPGVSRTHARIEREGNQFRLIDLSKYGTFVNGKQIKEVLLRNGDVIEFGPGGPKVSFQAEVSSTVPPRAVEPSLEPVIPRRSEPPPQQVIPQQPMPQAEVEQYASTPPKVSASLIILYGPTIREFRELPIIIGAGDRADFVISQPGILAQHVQIFFLNDRYWIKDLTGQRTIKVNNFLVGTDKELKTDDEIELTPNGPFFRFLGEGRLVEIDIPDYAVVAQPSARPEPEKDTSKQDGSDSNGGFFSRFFKGNR